MPDLTRHRLVTAVVGLADRHGRPARIRGPRRWTDLFVPLAVVSFLLVLVSGVLLAFWFEPSMRPVVYAGDYAPLRGVTMSEAYASTVRISMEVPGGLLVRQVHHWASLVFIAALSAHLLRVFLAGAFRGYRRLVWLILLALLVLSIAEAYLGHSLPDDLQSGTGLRVTEGYLLATPVVGTWLSWLVFGDEFPGDQIIGRLNTMHVWVLPVLIVGLGAAWALLAYRRWRAAPPVDGDPPRRYAVRMGGLALLVSGAIVAMSALVQVNPVWLWGPFDASQAPAGSRPPWYLGFLDGAVRLMPPWEVDVFGYTLTLSVLIPVMVLPGILMGTLALYPWFEQWATRDRRDPDVLDRPRDLPVRTALVAAFVAFYLVLWIAGATDVVATLLHVPLDPLVRFLQVAVVVVPPLAFWVTKRILLGLRLRDLDELRHGHATGIVVVSPEGGFSELHRPLTAQEAQRRAPREALVPAGAVAASDDNGVPNPRYRADRPRALASRFYFADLPGNRPVSGDVQVKEHG
ncbi:cytochrome b [Jiangella alba]|uniref:Cytochrome bc1 complex cytochrome b subunit n=1 Tax=Jiangella alba TaxID=561176 RepID=A0A1H5KAV2_9ACTN|nr:cytochrome b N-terminal domain-containing protein [Jiangella alba]SEE61925.1 ubiquinol-cytochrome c reductase cytochrome b subunit [Jiangella alba]